MTFFLVIISPVFLDWPANADLFPCLTLDNGRVLELDGSDGIHMGVSGRRHQARGPRYRVFE